MRREGSRFFYKQIATRRSQRSCGRALSETCGSLRRATSKCICVFRCRPAIRCRASTHTRHSFCSIPLRAAGANRSRTTVIEGILSHLRPGARRRGRRKPCAVFSAPDNCVDLSNQTTLLQLIRLIRTARFVISVDSGPMHIAAAVTDHGSSPFTPGPIRAASALTMPTRGFGKTASSAVRELPATANKTDKAAFFSLNMSRRWPSTRERTSASPNDPISLWRAAPEWNPPVTDR